MQQGLTDCTILNSLKENKTLLAKGCMEDLVCYRCMSDLIFRYILNCLLLPFVREYTSFCFFSVASDQKLSGLSVGCS